MMQVFKNTQAIPPDYSYKSFNLNDLFQLDFKPFIRIFSDCLMLYLFCSFKETVEDLFILKQHECRHWLRYSLYLSSEQKKQASFSTGLFSISLLSISRFILSL